VRLLAAITGEVGTGAGDTAPDASALPAPDRYARVAPDRLLSLDADVDDDGVPDDGVSPRTRVAPWATTPTVLRSDADVSVFVSPRAFAPDRGETTTIRVEVEAREQDRIYFVFGIYSLDGAHITDLQDGVPIQFGDGQLLLDWDGRDAHGEVVRGGTYIVLAQWGNTPGERTGRAKAAVVVVR
jgi:hypothetical protein